MVGDSALARLYVVVRGKPSRPVPQVDAAALERKLSAAVRSRDEDLYAEAIRVLGEEQARTLLDRFGASIPETYKADVTAADAVGDLSTMLGLRESGAEFGVRLVEHPQRWTLVVYRSGTPITLSDVLPSCSTWGSRWSMSTRISSPGARAPVRSGSTNSACGPRRHRLPAACARSSRTR